MSGFYVPDINDVGVIFFWCFLKISLIVIILYDFGFVYWFDTNVFFGTNDI